MTTESQSLGVLGAPFTPRSPQTRAETPPESSATVAREVDPRSVIVNEQRPASVPTEPCDVLAAQLLDEGGTSAHQSALRLLAGGAGIMLLQVACGLAPGAHRLADRLVGPPGLALAAAATLVIGLPGTLILLTALGSPPRFREAWGGLTRAYSQVGLLAGGFAPIVALFALTGGSKDLVLFLSFVAYAAAGVIALFGLTRRVVRAAGPLKLSSFGAGAGFLCFTLSVGLYLWVRLMEAIVP